MSSTTDQWKVGGGGGAGGGAVNITSILTGKSSASVISELKVYSDSLLLWVESVLLCPGLGMFWSANERSQYHYMVSLCLSFHNLQFSLEYLVLFHSYQNL